MWGVQDQHGDRREYTPSPGSEPIEPQNGIKGWMATLRWVLLGALILYGILSYYHEPMLTGIGRYLVVEHTPAESDLIVCLAGENLERGLAAAKGYRNGLAPRVFAAREEAPDGLAWVRKEGVEYPESIDLLVMLLQRLGVPRSAVLVGERPVGSTLEEARLIRDLVAKHKYSSLILITSPTHTRRVWLTFRKVFEAENVRIQVVATPYSGFRPEDWWKSRRYMREVLLEYQKLAYYVLRELR